MALFEFIMVLLSIVVGLGLTAILSGFARALADRQVTRDAWLPLLLAALVFLALIQVWWDSWLLRDVESWTFPQVLLMMANPVLLYVLAHLLFPERHSISLHQHYFDRHTLIFTTVSLAALTAMLFHPLAFGSKILAAYNVASVATALGALLLAGTRNPTLHAALVPAGAVITVADIVLGISQIS